MNLWQRLDAVFARVPDKWARVIAIVSLVATVPCVHYMTAPLQHLGNGRGYPIALFGVFLGSAICLIQIRNNIRDPVYRRWTFILSPIVPIGFLVIGAVFRLEYGLLS